MNEERITAAAAREMCGGVSDMTFWRWLHDPAMNFPKPDYIRKRRYWRKADLVAWLQTQAEAA
ncbi:MAG: transcriptional regulator [Proteobacteria bacterium]|nr:transcriptional regulator [Pseudomonadota bacterium]